MSDFDYLSERLIEAHARISARDDRIAELTDERDTWKDIADARGRQVEERDRRLAERDAANATLAQVRAAIPSVEDRADSRTWGEVLDDVCDILDGADD